MGDQLGIETFERSVLTRISLVCRTFTFLIRCETPSRLARWEEVTFRKQLRYVEAHLLDQRTHNLVRIECGIIGNSLETLRISGVFMI